jgi:hypothetical protein
VWEQCVDGTWTERTDCAHNAGAMQCDDTHGCVQCVPPGPACDGLNVRECNSDGTFGNVITTCVGTCANGGCIDPCSQAAANRSYIGCEYWPVDLDNAEEILALANQGFPCSTYNASATQVNEMLCMSGGSPAGKCDYNNDCSTAGAGSTCQSQAACVLDAQHSPFAIVVSNPNSGEMPATVTLENMAGMRAQVMVNSHEVKAIFPQMLGFPDQSLDFSGIEGKAYKLTSNVPIVAYQFNPLNNVGVFSNDASLLIPASTYDTTYVALDWPTLTRRPTAHDYNAYITVVASSPGTTTVTVQSTARVRAGNMVGAFGPGSQQFQLQQFQTLNLEAVGGTTPGGFGDDFTGSKITGDKPFGMFVGHEATNLSQMQPTPCCADHLEEQLFPASTWGKKFAIARSKSRNTGEPDLLRIVALRDNTTVAFNPTSAGTCPTLAANAHCDVFVQNDVEVEGSDPILIGHLIVSTGGIAMDSGDPSLSLAVPSEQFRHSYLFLVPSQYNFNYVSLVASGAVTLDGTDVSSMLTAFGSGMYKGGRLLLQPGAHDIECPDGCGIEVYGWSDAVSYMFAGGLDLKQIVVP